jgi:hypothetical protein
MTPCNAEPVILRPRRTAVARGTSRAVGGEQRDTAAAKGGVNVDSLIQQFTPDSVRTEEDTISGEG